jgi:hypothetical protein
MDSLVRLIRIPALITLGVTLLRLIGELNHWSPALFNREPGGGGALVGIAWLPLIFGPIFAIKLAQSGAAPLKAGRTLLYAVSSLLAFLLITFGGMRALGVQQNDPPSLGAFLVFVLASVVASIIAYVGSPVLAKVLFAYSLAARIPVVIVMLVAMLGNWGTHYDVVPPNFPEMGVFARWLMIGVLPQFTVWIAFTIVLGCLFGGLALALWRGKPALQTA